MAYQPKSYRKFVATAATATMVASAVTPAFAAQDFTDVPKQYKEAVDYLVKNDLTKGVSETQFGIDQQIKRVDFAIMLAKAVLTQEQINNAKASSFTDVPDRGVKEVNALKEAGIINGKSDTRFGASDEITRGEAALMFANAYKIKGDTANIKFTDVGDRYKAAVAALVDNNITSGKTPTKFGTTDQIKRGEFAIFLYKLETLDQTEPGKVATKITNVEAINDTKIEISFDGAINADVADEIEKDGKRIVVFHGGQTANSNDVIQSKFISFNADRTKASVILDDASNTVQAGINYTVALMDGDTPAVAGVVLKSEPTVLKTGADKPSFEVNQDQDKFVLNFKKKMSDEALDLDNYTLYDENDKEMGKLTSFVKSGEQSKWVDSTEKTAVEFKIEPGTLLAGKTYKVKVEAAVETDKGDKLTDSQRTITVKTPSITDAQPVAKVARIVDNNIIVTFDKDLDSVVNLNTSLITIKSPTGKTLTIGSPLATDGNELTIPIAQGANDVVLDKDLTYTIDLPANGVANEVFTNATNKEVKGLKAVAQKDVEVQSVKAQLVRQADQKTKADLLLTFDQRVNPATIDPAKVTIEESGAVHALVSLDNVEVYSGDTTGKTIKIKDVETSFDFTPEAGTNYTVVVASGGVQTDAGADAKTNREKLTASLTGVDIVAPKISKVTVESAEKIVVKFDQNIDAKNLSASDITVQGYEKYRGGRFEQLPLQGSTQLKFSASGDTLTITPVDSSVKFQTGADTADAKVGLVTIAADAIKGTNGIVADSELKLAADKVDKFIDNAAPIMIGAKAEPTTGLTITYSEPVAFKGSDAASVGSQFTLENADRNSYGTTASVTDNEVSVTFKDNVFKAGEDYSQTKVIYKRNATSAVKDVEYGNEQANATLTGVSNPSN